MPNITVKNRQNLADLAVQQAGDVVAMAELAILNDLSLTDEPAPGAQLQPATVNNKSVVSFFQTELKSPATKDEAVINEGIGYWRIGIDFKVS